jgi:hypothetical protein
VLAVQGKGRRSKDEIVVIDNTEAVEALYAWLAQRGDAPEGYIQYQRAEE